MSEGMNSWLNKFYYGIDNWLRVRFKWPYRTTVVEETLPKRLLKKILYIVQEDGFLEQASMLCPCGCGRILQMNLIPDEHPCWELTRHSDRTATLYPSVWRKKDCGSHFWFRQGRVHWCGTEED